MNLYIYWNAGPGRVLWSNLAFANGFYRPLGGLFYLPAYAVAGLNPILYRWAILILLAVNVVLLFRLARCLGGTERMALIASLFGALHACMPGLLYSTADIYDILCRTFCLLSLITYMRGRKVWAIVLMLVAINAKEMAATLPAFFLLYEVLYNKRRTFSYSLAALALAALAMYGKMHGAEAMTANEMYRPTFTLQRWLDNNASYTNELLYLRLPNPQVIGLWMLMALTCLAVKRREMWWAFGFILLVTVPTSFIPKRDGSSLYIPLVGWAIWMASLFDWAASRIRHRYIRWSAFAAVALSYSWVTEKRFGDKGQLIKSGQAYTMQPLSQLQSLHETPRHGSRVLFIGSPFHDGFDMVFLANLTWNDHSLTIADANVSPDRDPSHYDVVLKFDAAGVIRRASAE